MTEPQTSTPKTVAPRPPAADKDKRAAMLMHHVSRIRPLQMIHEERKAAATAAATNVTSSLDVAVADLNGFPGPKVDRDWLKRRIAMASRDQRDLLEELVLDRWANGVQGVVVDQIDAFGTEATPQSAKDGLYFNAQGYQHGVNGLPSTPPEGMHSMFFNDYETGWGNGQTALVAYLEQGKAIKAAQTTPSTAAPVDLSGGDEDEGGEDEDLDDAARALKAGGFMETGSDADDPDETQALADKLRDTGFAPEAPKGRRRAPKGVH